MLNIFGVDMYLYLVGNNAFFYEKFMFYDTLWRFWQKVGTIIIVKDSMIRPQSEGYNYVLLFMSYISYTMVCTTQKPKYIVIQKSLSMTILFFMM